MPEFPPPVRHIDDILISEEKSLFQPQQVTDLRIALNFIGFVDWDETVKCFTECI